VTELQGSFQLDVVDNENKVSLRPVRVGEQMGKSWIIEEGLKSGERIIVEGLQKVRADTVVSPRPVTGLAKTKG
jgi:multidrug efflux pump subunit AcrA (membrane-fusion protein)